MSTEMVQSLFSARLCKLLHHARQLSLCWQPLLPTAINGEYSGLVRDIHDEVSIAIFCHPLT